MIINKLSLNSDKRELLVLNARHRPPHQLEYIFAGTDLIQTSKSVKNIGVWYDNTLSMNKEMTMICKTGFYHLRNIAIIRKVLSHK